MSVLRDFVLLQGSRRIDQRGAANRDTYHRTFNGIELAATKRLKHRWMGRFGVSWNRAREFFDDPSKAVVDPTPITVEPRVNGSLLTVPTAGSGKSQIYLTLSSYQLTANGSTRVRGG